MHKKLVLLQLTTLNSKSLMSLSASNIAKLNVEFWHDCFSNLGSTPEEYVECVVVLEVTQIPWKLIMKIC